MVGGDGDGTEEDGEISVPIADFGLEAVSINHSSIVLNCHRCCFRQSQDPFQCSQVKGTGTLNFGCLPHIGKKFQNLRKETIPIVYG